MKYKVPEKPEPQVTGYNRSPMHDIFMSIILALIVGGIVLVVVFGLGAMVANSGGC